MSGILELIETYQTLIVGILGFLGVIATLIFNSKLSRDLRKDELKHERNSIRQALITELESLKGSFKDKSESVETDQDWFLPKHNSDCNNVLVLNMEVLIWSFIQISGRSQEAQTYRSLSYQQICVEYMFYFFASK